MSETADSIVSFVGVAIMLGLMGGSCYGTVHGVNEHGLGWMESSIPIVSGYWAVEGLFFHTDGVDEFCARMYECRHPSSPITLNQCVASTRADLDNASPANKKVFANRAHQLKGLSCEQIWHQALAAKRRK